MWVCHFWETGLMGVCVSSSSHIVKASWRCLVGRNSDVKPQERGGKERGRGRKCPSLFHERTCTDRGHTWVSRTSAEQDLSRSFSERGTTWKKPNDALISYPSCESSNICKVSVNLSTVIAHTCLKTKPWQNRSYFINMDKS